MANSLDDSDIIRHNRRIMKISIHNTDDAILGEIGARLARLRLDQDLSQADLALRAGVSKRTVERLESGAVSTNFSSIIRICRALDLIEQLDALFPELLPSPMALLKHRGKQRRRVSSKKRMTPPVKGWTWGDES